MSSSVVKGKSETPMMRQHREIKARYPDAILLFRVGDFYETFGEDAVIAARVLGITLTRRSNGAAAATELAGFPHHAVDTYLHKLVKAGYRVAVCDQLEDPKQAKGIVKRGITEMVTPGVATADKLLENKTNNFLAAVHLEGEVNGVAFLDISTGEFFVAEGDSAYIDKLLQSFQPSEIVLSKGRQKKFRDTYDSKTYFFALEDWIFTEQYCYETLLQHFNTQSLKGYGVEDMRRGIIASGAAIHYLKDTEHPNLEHINALQRIVADTFLWMDRFTIRNLELIQSSDGQSPALLQALDYTTTPMGARLLRRWLIFPLFDLQQINERLDTVTLLIREQELSNHLIQAMKQMGDVERLISKVSLRKASPREMVQLARSLAQMQLIKEAILFNGDPLLANMANQIQPCTELQEQINNTLREDAPAVAAKGDLIKDGANQRLDELRNISRNGKEFLLKIQQEEIARTGISSLKVAFNNVFGYYLEVTNTHKDKVPADWTRKQTLANAERYITAELKEYEEQILGAEEKILALEQELFQQLILAAAPFVACIQQNAQAIARLDCLLCFAHNAKRYHYHRPEIAQDTVLDITEGRHPVIEQRLPAGEHYVANDMRLDADEQQIIILTGPNMSGKSALLRQTAIIVLMAHMGSYVPAQKAVIGLTDKIFTRVGASDNLGGGESTFMVEMNETASIINNLSARSLVLLDEIGRGTSTYDGISLAWSIVEFLQKSPARPKTLFATHYHELNELENVLARVKNFHITHQEVGNKVIFLRKLAPGGSRHSFGIQVARMAGMPPSLLKRAEEILATLEAKHHQEGGAHVEASLRQVGSQTFQLNIFDGLAEDLRRIQQALDETDINTLTPVEALMKLNELKGMVERYK